MYRISGRKGILFVCLYSLAEADLLLYFRAVLLFCKSRWLGARAQRWMGEWGMIFVFGFWWVLGKGDQEDCCHNGWEFFGSSLGEGLFMKL